jgi:hypothetical protein
MKILSTFYSDDGSLTAEVTTIPGQSVFVNFLVHNMSIGQIDYSGKALRYAEDAAENFVMGIFKPEDVRKYIEENKNVV